MRGVVAVALALLVSSVLSGCVAEKGGEAQSVSSTASASASGTATASKSATASKAPAPVAAPTANLTASALAGPAPLNVTFTVSGTTARNELVWVLAAGGSNIGNGTGVPATLNHTFAEAGNVTVVLSVFDGKQNATANVTIAVAAGNASAPAAAFEPIHDEYDVAAFCELCTDLGPGNCVSLQAGVAGGDCGWTELPAEAAGHAFAVATHGAVTGNADIAFMAACDAGAAVIAVQTAVGPEAGVVPEGAGCLVAWDYDGVEPMLPFSIDIA